MLFPLIRGQLKIRMIIHHLELDFFNILRSLRSTFGDQLDNLIISKDSLFLETIALMIHFLAKFGENSTKTEKTNKATLTTISASR